jgi:hypothetical protein
VGECDGAYGRLFANADWPCCVLLGKEAHNYTLLQFGISILAPEQAGENG